MAHIHTGPGEHDATASALIIRFDTPQPSLLLHWHKKLNSWMQPGGHVELHQTPWQAALSEIEQETGYTAAQLRVLQPRQRLMQLTGAVLHPVPVCENTHSFNDEHSHTDRAYAFSTYQSPAYLPADGESNRFKWVTSTTLEQINEDDIKLDIRQIARYALQVCAADWEQVSLSDFEA